MTMLFFIVCVALLLTSTLPRVTPPERRRRTLQPLPVGIRDFPSAKPEWVRNRVIYLASHLSSCREVAMAFNRWHGTRAYVGKTYVWEVMVSERARIASLRKERKRRPPAEIAPRKSWALDLTFFLKSDGRLFTVLAIIDVGSRMALRVCTLPSKCTHLILAQLHIAIATYGKPTQIRTDNESMFASSLWRNAMRLMRIHHRRGPPGQPWRNGRIERFIGTMKSALPSKTFETTASLQRALRDFVAFYNNARPHQGLGGITPTEAWKGKTIADVQARFAHVERALDGAGARDFGEHLRL